MEQWFSNNRLTLNVNKTNYVVFSSSAKRINKIITLKIGGEEITKVQTCKYLGVTLDASLHYKEHIKIVCSKLSRACFTLYQARYHFPLSTLKAIYFGTFHCHLTYCVETWGNTYHSYLEPVVILQKCALRIMTFSTCTAHSAPLFKQLEIMPFLLARDFKIACVTRNIISNNNPLPSSIFITPVRNTRTQSDHNFNIPPAHNCYGKRTLQYVGTKILNNIPPHVKQSQNFSSTLKKYVQSKELTSLI